MTTDLPETLSDRLLRWQPPEDDFVHADLSRKLVDVQAKLTDAHKFVFDRSASQKLRHLIVNTPRTLLENLSTAVLPPHARCWIEHGIFPNYFSNVDEVNNTGMLIDGKDVSFVTLLPLVNRTVVEDRGHAFRRKVNLLKASPTFNPGVRWTYSWEEYRLGTWHTDHRRKFFIDEKIQDSKRAVFGTLSQYPEWRSLRKKEYEQLLEAARITVPNYDERFYVKKSDVTFGGRLALILGAITLLNTSNVYHYRHVPAAVKSLDHRTNIQRAYTVVTMDIGSRDVIRWVEEAREPGGRDRTPHQVRGHLVYSYGARESSCEHEWVQDDPKHHRCVRCAGRRWWRREHPRGHGETSPPVKTYAVKQEPESQMIDTGDLR